MYICDVFPRKGSEYISLVYYQLEMEGVRMRSFGDEYPSRKGKIP